MTTSETSPAPEEAPPVSGSSIAQTLATLAVLTVISAGSGVFLGLTLEGTPVENPRPAEKSRGTHDISKVVSEKPRGSAEHGDASDNGAEARGAGHTETATRQSLVVKEMPPIITNLAVPETSWVRLQAAIVYDAKAVPNAELLVTELMSDIVVFLRTVSLASIEGADGLRSLHEDLSERVTVRSEGLVREFIIQALVVQ